MISHVPEAKVLPTGIAFSDFPGGIERLTTHIFLACLIDRVAPHFIDVIEAGLKSGYQDRNTGQISGYQDIKMFIISPSLSLSLSLFATCDSLT